jgi:hypothetical protein
LAGEDRKNVDRASQQAVDYISDAVKVSSIPLFSEFVKLATDLYTAGQERRV